MTLLASVLRDLAFEALSQYPQWVYVNSRGTGDAIATYCI